MNSARRTVTHAGDHWHPTVRGATTARTRSPSRGTVERRLSSPRARREVASHTWAPGLSDLGGPQSHGHGRDSESGIQLSSSRPRRRRARAGLRLGVESRGRRPGPDRGCRFPSGPTASGGACRSRRRAQACACFHAHRGPDKISESAWELEPRLSGQRRRSLSHPGVSPAARLASYTRPSPQ